MRLFVSLLVIVLICLSLLLSWGQDPSGMHSEANGLESSDTPASAALNASQEEVPDKEVELAQVGEQPARETPEATEPVEIEPEEEAAEEEELRFPGPDPIQTGECSLVLHFFDSLSGEPVSGKADLWRLDAPGNDHWTKGDQKQVTFTAKEGTARCDKLPPGRYRVFSRFARKGSGSAQEFSIAGELTSASISVEMPQMEQVFLRLVDAQGKQLASSEVRRLEIKNCGYQHTTRSGLEPEWQVTRMPLNSNVLGMLGGGGGYKGASHRSWNPVEHGPQGILVGELRGDAREARRSYRRKLRMNGGSGTTVLLETHGTGEYVAVLPSHQEIHDRLEFPADATRLDLMDELWITVEAVPVDTSLGESTSSQWSLSEVTIRISVSEYQNVNVKWIPGEEPVPFIKLQNK